jgi:phosphoglucosamine mutase
LNVILRRVLLKLFGTDGVRGIANEEPITPASVIRLMESAAAVLTRNFSRPVAVVGRDTRASGELLEAAVASGLAASGVDVLLAGIIPTPALAYLTRSLSAAFGVVISASHNPFEDNGIKFFRSTGYKLSDDEESAIERLFFEPPGGQSRPTGQQIGRVRKLEDAIERYAAFALSTWPCHASLRGRHLALDLANGAAHQSTPLVLGRLGARIEVCSAQPDGFNINENCGSMHLENLSSVIRQTGAELGIAHDGDADRVLLCDELGAPLDGDEMMAILGHDLLRRNALRGKTVVATLMSNYGLDEVLRPFGGRLIRTQVGDRYVIEAMVDGDFNFGGEQSGHLVLRDFTTTGDGLLAALQLLAVWASSGRKMSELRQLLRKCPQVQRNIDVRERIPFGKFPKVMENVERAQSKLAGKGRVLLRYSGTELKARLLLEGPDSAALDELADAIEQSIRQNVGV